MNRFATEAALYLMHVRKSLFGFSGDKLAMPSTYVYSLPLEERHRIEVKDLKKEWDKGGQRLGTRPS